MFAYTNREGKPQYFAWGEVHAARRDRMLQGRHPRHRAIEHYAVHAQPCPECKTPALDLIWCYVESDPISWELLCGRAGWLTVCEACHLQVDFFMEAMN